MDELVLVEQRVLEELARWEQYLLEAEAPGFIAGEGLSPSVADCAFFPVLAYLQYHGLELFPRYPALAGYADRMMQLPSSLAAYPSHWSPFSNRKNLFARLHSVARR